MIGPRKVDKDLILYGAGKLGKLALQMFGELKIPVRMILDKDSYTGAMHPDHVSQAEKENSLIAVCVASSPYKEILCCLAEKGWTDIVPVWDVIEAYPELGIRNGWFSPIEDWPKLIAPQKWADAQSIYDYSIFTIWRRFQDEYAILSGSKEALPSTLADIRQRQRVETFADAPMKNIPIHCEGCELKTLKENIALFQKYRPRLEVACYHSRDGLWKIEKFLMDNLERYRFYFRLHAYQGQGAYIYCIPEERNEKV